MNAPFTKPVKRGRPFSKGKFRTRQELVDGVVERFHRGFKNNQISRYTGISDVTVKKILITEGLLK